MRFISSEYSSISISIRKVSSKVPKVHFTFLGMRVIIFSCFHKKNVRKYENTVLGYKKELKWKLISPEYSSISICIRNVSSKVPKVDSYASKILDVIYPCFHKANVGKYET